MGNQISQFWLNEEDGTYYFLQPKKKKINTFSKFLST